MFVKSTLHSGSLPRPRLPSPAESQWLSGPLTRPGQEVVPRSLTETEDVKMTARDPPRRSSFTAEIS